MMFRTQQSALLVLERQGRRNRACWQSGRIDAPPALAGRSAAAPRTPNPSGARHPLTHRNQPTLPAMNRLNMLTTPSAAGWPEPGSSVTVHGRRPQRGSPARPLLPPPLGAGHTRPSTWAGSLATPTPGAPTSTTFAFVSASGNRSWGERVSDRGPGQARRTFAS